MAVAPGCGLMVWNVECGLWPVVHGCGPRLWPDGVCMWHVACGLWFMAVAPGCGLMGARASRVYAYVR